MTQEFIRGRQYLKAVSPHTIIWHVCSFKAFEGALDSKEAIRERIVQLRQRNVSPITINSYLRCINAYLRWLHEEHAREFIKIPNSKRSRKSCRRSPLPQSRKSSRIRPKLKTNGGFILWSAFDTGLRIWEALTLAWQNADLDNLVVKIHGKRVIDLPVPAIRESLPFPEPAVPATPPAEAEGQPGAVEERPARNDL